MRKASTTTTTVTHVNDFGNAPRRTTSGRAVRANTTRPANYYARPFGSFTAAGAANSVETDMQDAEPAGFFPALQFFTDAITALPKEMTRQFLLLKEVEGKILGPNERIGEMVDELMQYPVPPRKSAQNAEAAPGQGFLSFTANNSVTGSTAASVVNGIAPNTAQLSAQNSMAGSQNGEEAAPAENEEELVKRRKFHHLRLLAHSSLVNLDEKILVLSEANRVLSTQLSRIDSVLPHIDNEISEEARLGSMTHWAYSDNRQKKTVGGAAASRRDVAATNNLAAAASAMHEADIAQARRDAGRETAREKHKSRRDVDSDFDDKPKKTHAKTAKSKAAAGLGITSNGEPVKRRKLDKSVVPPGMERTLSAMAKGPKTMKETPRSTPMGEPSKKMIKAKPTALPAKKRRPNSSHASPGLASSPLQSSFSATAMEPPNGRAPVSRLRQNSTATNLRHERILDEEAGRPTSAPSRVNGEKVNGKRKAIDDEQEQRDNEPATKTIERGDSFKHEDVDMADNEHPPQSKSGSNSGKAGRGSETGTPRTDNFSDVPAMLRTRSTRSMRGGNPDESSSEPQIRPSGKHHKRAASNSHLVKQLAPFNRSPRERAEDEMDEDVESVDGQRAPEAEGDRSPPKRRPSSRRNTGALLAPSSPPPVSDHGGDEDDTVMADAEPEETEDVASIPDLEPEPAADEGSLLEEDEDSEPGDPDDPNEPKYCYCNRGSYGEMIACDNDDCPREWFHLGCTGLREPPEEDVKWYCDDCRPLFVKARGKGRVVRR